MLHGCRPSVPQIGLISVKSVHCSLCPAGRLQLQATAVNSAQPNDRPPGSPDTSMLSSELQQQWDAEMNLHLGAIRVKPQSGIKAVWQCNKCPAGRPHIWTATVQNRTRGNKCPYCTNRLVCLHNSLATLAPDVASILELQQESEGARTSVGRQPP